MICLAIVADGLGGHRGGREASHLAMREFVARYRKLAATLEPQHAAKQALAAVNQLIHTRGRRDPSMTQMGTTFTALILHDAQGHIVHIGDTRAYRLRAGRIELLTHDHNLAVMGRPNVLYRALGTDTEVEVDHVECVTITHDRFLLCSDGVYSVLPDAALSILLQRADNLQACAEHVTQAALRANSQDNVTAVIVEIMAQPLDIKHKLQWLVHTGNLAGLLTITIGHKLKLNGISGILITSHHTRPIAPTVRAQYSGGIYCTNSLPHSICHSAARVSNRPLTWRA